MNVAVPPNSSWNGWLWLVIISTTKDISWTKEWIPQHNSISNENYLRLVAVKCKSSNANMLVLTVATNFIQMSSSRRPSTVGHLTADGGSRSWELSERQKEPTVQSCLVTRSSWSGVCIYHWCYHFLLIADWGSGGTVARAPSCPAQLTRGTPDHRHSWSLCYVRRTAAVGAGYLNKPSSTCWLQCGAWSCVVQPARALSAVAVVALIVTTLMIPAQPSTSLLQWAGRHLADAQDTGQE